MSAGWKIAYRKALISAVVRLGSLHDPYANAYWGSSAPKNWQELDRKVREIGIDFDRCGDPIEAEWEVFAGTFADADHRRYGVDIHIVLNDGTKVWYRYSDSMGELITAVLAED